MIKKIPMSFYLKAICFDDFWLGIFSNMGDFWKLYKLSIKTIKCVGQAGNDPNRKRELGRLDLCLVFL